jgi:GntR family transcriptional regulator, uxu operon transcriptional repressor
LVAKNGDRTVYRKTERQATMAGIAADTGNAAARLPGQLRYQLAELILAESAQAGLGPGSRLPTERQLAADLGATRTSVRHALGVLEAAGHISREVGRGTFLRHPPAQLDGQDGPYPAAVGLAVAGLARPRPDPGPGPTGQAVMTATGHDAGPATSFAPADVMAIRRLLEPAAMPLAVAWATAADFVEMDRCLAGGNRAGSYEEFETWDLGLHRSIVAASHSPLLAELYAVIEAARHGQSWGDLKRRSASRDRRERYQADHAELVAALRARNTGRATEAMHTHLARVHADLFGGTT